MSHFNCEALQIIVYTQPKTDDDLLYATIRDEFVSFLFYLFRDREKKRNIWLVV